MEGVLERDSVGVGRGWPKTTRYNLAEEERMRGGGDHIKQRTAAASSSFLEQREKARLN